MKQYIKSWVALLCLFISTNNLLAQDSNAIIMNATANYTTLWDSMHTGININEVPYKVLYDRVYGWSGLRNKIENSQIDKPTLVQAWYDLFTASCNFNRGLTYKQFREYLLDYELNKRIPIIAIEYNYSIIDSSANTALHLNIDSLGNYTDSNDIAAVGFNKPLPFTKKQIRMAGLHATEFEDEDEITMVLDENLFLENQQIKSYELNLF
jgi:hypothetical protein